MVETVHDIDVFEVDELSRESGLKFYDSSYVWLAHNCDVKLYTRDGPILRAFPGVACMMPELE